MRAKFVGDKRDSFIHIVKNEDTVNIPRGTPLVLAVNGTDDGLAVVLPSTAGALKSQLAAYGVLATSPNLQVNQAGESIVFGYSQFTLVTGLTRSATTASWPSSASVAALAPLQIDTANNAFMAVGTFAGSNFLAQAVLLDSIGSQAGSASNATDTRLAISQTLRTFVRML